MSSRTYCTLSFRTEPTGGDVSPDHWLNDIEAFKHQSHLILMVHGYNSDVPGTNKSMDNFEQRMDAACMAGRDWRDGAQCVRVYWPGDVDWGLLSVLGYPLTIKPAEESGNLFSEALRTLTAGNPDLRVSLIVHSLGNHFTLQALSGLNGAHGLGPRISHMVMMAAAVPTTRLAKQGDGMNRGLDQALVSTETSSLHTPHDWVLAFAFPPGETAAGGEGFFPTALGHQHWDEAPSALNQQFAQPTQSRKYVDHTHYWTGISENQMFDLLGVPVTVARRTTVMNQSERATLVKDDPPSRVTQMRETLALYE